MSKKIVKQAYALFIISLFFNYSSTLLADEQVDRVVKFITENAAKIGGEENIGVSTSMEWKLNKEVIEVSSYEDTKRVAALETAISYLGENEKITFPEIKSSDHAIVFLLSRLIALEYLSSLVGSSDNDLVLKDYFYGEISDIKMMLNGTVNFGAMYLKSRKMRDDKRGLFLSQNKEFVREKLTLMMKKPNISNFVANKTSLISLLQACGSVPESCSKL